MVDNIRFDPGMSPETPFSDVFNAKEKKALVEANILMLEDVFKMSHEAIEKIRNDTKGLGDKFVLKCELVVS